MNGNVPPGLAALSGTTFPAFGTTAGVWVTDAAALPACEAALRAWIAVVDRACSRFRADSDLSRANAAAGGAAGVCDELLDATAAALAMAEATEGWYDPTVGRAVINAGYDRGFEEIRSGGPGVRGPAEPAGRWREVVVDRAAGTLTVPPGVALDLGGSAKGWAVDRALALLRDVVGDATGICVSAGGDLAVCGTPPPGGWPVLLADELDGSADGVWLHIDGGAVATSGAIRRRWLIDGEELHHIVDPRTGRSATGPWRTVTIHAPACVVADTAATAAWLMGERAAAWLSQRGLGARLVRSAGDELWVGGLAPDPEG